MLNPTTQVMVLAPIYSVLRKAIIPYVVSERPSCVVGLKTLEISSVLNSV